MAASKSHSFVLPILFIFVILLAITGLSVAGHNVPKTFNKDEKKEPEFFLGHDGSFLIPGAGRVLKPHKFVPYRAPYAPRTGGSTGISGGGGTGASAPPGRSYVPGGDDTFVPNPGFEVPNPGHP